MYNCKKTIITLALLTLSFSNIIHALPSQSQSQSQNQTSCESSSSTVTYNAFETELSASAKTLLEPISEWFSIGCTGGKVLLSTPIPQHLGTESPEWTLAIRRTTIITLQLMDMGVPKDSIERVFPTGELAEQGQVDINIVSANKALPES